MRAVKNNNKVTQPIYSGNHVKTPSQMMATPKVQKNPASSNLKNTNIARVDRLFAHLGAIYGHVWHSQFKSEGFLNLAKEVWADGLSKIDDKNIEMAIDACKREYPMPLSLPAFYQLCRRFQLSNQITVPDNRAAGAFVPYFVEEFCHDHTAMIFYYSR